MSLLDTASLIVTPNAYAESKLYSVIPSDGSGDLSVTRATTATRVNSAGLVELVPYNFVRYSQDFTNGAWVKLGTSLSVTGNTTIAPDGTLTADTLNVSNNNNILYQSASTGFDFTGNTYTFSIYAKGSGTFAMNVRLNSTTTTTETKTLTSEWQRFQVSVTQPAAVTSVETYLELNTSSTYFVWGAQSVEGSTAKDYQKTETRLNIPRLDYSNGTCPSLLVEPQRTNAVTYSEFFSTANGYNYQNASQSGSSIVSPSGQLAYGITSTTSANDFHRYYKTLGGRSGVNTTTIFAKKGTSRYLGLGVNQNGSTGNNNVVVFDLQDGVIASNIYGVTASIEDFGNDWYRLVHTFDYGTGGTYADICVHNTGTSTYTINAFQTFDSPSSPTTIYVWGLQMEVGSYATSYIPTTSASVTRNADVISKTGISSLIGQTEGTLFFEIANIANDGGVKAISLSNGTIGQTVEFAYYGNNEYNFIVRNGVQTYSYASSLPNVTEFTKFAFAYKQNDFALYINGNQVNTSSSGNVPTSMDRLEFDWAGGAFDFYGKTKSLALWQTRLTNTQLAQLTTI
jgi:hypothetical protein